MLLGVLMGILAGSVPKVGEVAPDFTAVDTAGVSHHLDEMVKHGPVIVAFFPKAFTPGCTREMTAYKDRYKDVEQTGATVLAISMDDADKLREFKESLKATFAFVPDPKGDIVGKYDVKMPVISLAKRYTFVVGEGRKILKVDSGSDAVDPTAAIVSCPLSAHKK